MNETPAYLDLVVSGQADGQPQSIDYTSFDTYKLYIIDNSQEALEHLLLVALAYIALCLSVYFLICRRRVTLVDFVKFPSCRRVLIVTAHPDDECMFFGPTILSLTHRNDCSVFLMCLSNGNKPVT